MAIRDAKALAGEWRAVPGARGYEVSRDGRIRSARNGSIRLLRPSRQHTGYFTVYLRMDDGVAKTLLVHRLVLQAFAGPCPPGMECRHLDGCRSNNAITNLAWGTKQENQEDKVRHGTVLRGSAHPARRRPDLLSRGDAHYSRVAPEKLARGSRNGSYTKPEQRPKGESHGCAKLTDSAVMAIVERCRAGHRHEDIAADHGVSRSTISLIGRNKIWTHLPREPGAGRSIKNGAET